MYSHQLFVALSWSEWLTLFAPPLGLVVVGLLGAFFVWKYIE